MVVQMERERLRKETQLREEALREKEEMERKMLQLQEECRIAQENLVSPRFWPFHLSFVVWRINRLSAIKQMTGINLSLKFYLIS